jgi:phage terminase large subunit-like protein
MEVRRVELLENCQTYNLTVDCVNEYIANGVVVHNCDELAAWEYLRESWDMIQFGIRLGNRTKLICSTTPKPKDVVMELIDREGDDVVITRASTYSNIANLAKSFQKQILQYEGTNLGRQEIHAEIIDPEEGGIVRRDWFRLWPNGKPFPPLEFIIQSYDCATSDKTHNDPTGSITLGVFKPMDGGMSVMVLDCWQEHLQYPDLRPKVIDEFETVYGEGRERKLVDLILVEDKSAGISLIQDLQRAHLPVHAYNPGKADKIQRLSIVANIIKAGRVWVPESSVRKGYVKDWAEGMVSQICSFPETVHDEFVDCISQGLRYLRDGGWISIDAPPRDPFDGDDILDAEEYNKRQRVNPYAV